MMDPLISVAPKAPAPIRRDGRGDAPDAEFARLLAAKGTPSGDDQVGAKTAKEQSADAAETDMSGAQQVPAEGAAEAALPTETMGRAAKGLEGNAAPAALLTGSPPAAVSPGAAHMVGTAPAPTPAHQVPAAEGELRTRPVVAGADAARAPAEPVPTQSARSADQPRIDLARGPVARPDGTVAADVPAAAQRAPFGRNDAAERGADPTALRNAADMSRRTGAEVAPAATALRPPGTETQTLQGGAGGEIRTKEPPRTIEARAEGHPSTPATPTKATQAGSPAAATMTAESTAANLAARGSAVASAADQALAQGQSDGVILDELPPMSGTDGRGEAERTAPQARHLDAAREAPRAVVQQMLDAARQLKDGPIEIRLSPEELGRVRLSLAPGDGGMSVVITAERAETLDLMRRSIDALAADLKELGYGGLEFAFGREKGGPADSGTKATGEDATGAQIITDSPAARAGHGPQIGTLDMRL